MEIMIFGLLLWSLVHFVPSLGQPIKKAWIKILGENGYKISFAALVVLSLVLIVYGWRHSSPTLIYALPITVKPVVLALMVVAFLLFGAAKQPTRIKRFVRHPQLMSIIVWSVAHLLVNGDSRSLLLFGWLGVWAAMEIMLINRREGQWQKQTSPGWGREFKGLVISLAIFAVAAFAHPYIAGVAIK